MGVEFKLNKPVSQIVRDVIGGDKTALFMAEKWHTLYDPFVPMYSGMLAHGTVSHTIVPGGAENLHYSVEDGKGIITHDSPYANNLYNGDSFNFYKQEHPLATAHWDEAAKQAGKAKQLEKETIEFIKRGAK